MQKSSLVLTGVCAFLTLGTLPGEAAEWGQWRGPEFNGSTVEKGLPQKWSRTDGVKWSIALPGPSAASPVVWDKTVFLSVARKTSKDMWAMAVDRESGKVKWERKTGEGYSRDDKSNYASPSPVTDGKQAFFFYGNGELVAFDMDGKEQWRRNIQTDYGDFAFQWTFSSSPLLTNGKLILQVLQRNHPVHGKGKEGGESFLLCLDPANGKTIWKAIRPSDAMAESLESFATPIPWAQAGRQEILIAGGDCLSGHDPETGKEYWRSMSWNPTKLGHWRLVSSPAAGAGIILGCAPKGAPIYAVKSGANGMVSEKEMAWISSENRSLTSDVPTPAFYEGDFFVLSDVRRSLSRLDPSGKVKWSIETPGRAKYEASPIAADGKIYLMNFASDVTVVEAATGELKGTMAMGDDGENESRATPSIAHGQLFIRTNQKLYCVGK